MIIVFFVVIVICIYFLYLNKKGKLEIFNQYVKSWEDGRVQARKVVKRIGIQHLDDLIENNHLMAISILHNEKLGDDKYRQSLSDGILSECVGIKHYRLQKTEGKGKYPNIYSKDDLTKVIQEKVKEEWILLENINTAYLNYKNNKELDPQYAKQILKIIDLRKNLILKKKN